MKILLCSHEMSYTGAPRSLKQMAGVLADAGYDVTVWTLKGGDFEREFEKEGIEVTTVSFPEMASEEFAETIRQFSIVIANTIFCAAFARYAGRYTRAVLYLREAVNIPELISTCNLNIKDLTDAEHIVCVSEYAEKFIEESYQIKNCKVIHNFTDDLYSSIFRNRTNKKKTFDFLVSGTIEPRKGQKVAIDAFFLLSDEIRKKARLHLVGAMPDWAKDYQKQLRLNASDGVIYHGEITDRDELLQFYESMDVVIVSSTDESCSLVALEAAMLGKVLILTDHVGAKYLVDDSCIIEAGDSEKLSRKMCLLFEHPEKVKQFGEENRKRYLEEGTRTVYKKNFLDYIEKLDEESEKEKHWSERKVSVIVPVYNVEKYLRKCLDSLLDQTLPELEFICVNDGSTDKSLEILNEYRQRDSRIKVITTENHGYGHAMNIGIKAACGEYVGIVEPDDYVDKRMYEILYHRAIAVDADIVKADFYRFIGEGEAQENIYQQTARVAGNYGRVIVPQKEKECFRFIMNTWSGIYRRSFLESYRIFHNETPGAAYQDNGFWFQGFCQAERIYFVNEALYYNRRDNPSSSVNSRGKIYCANEEYAYIRSFLSEHKELEKEFLYQYSMKKYHTYLFTLNRIGWEYKKEYVKRFAEEFLEAEKKGELSQAVFTPQEWSNLHWIMRDHEDYYEKVVKAEIQISVVIPVYNAGNYLEQCLGSLEKQTFRKFEVICIDDGSTDDSAEIIQRFTGRDKRFLLYQQKNAGAGAARNKGLSLSHGEYVLFLDADDYFASEMLFLAYNRIRETDAEICVIGSWQHDEETGIVKPCTYSLQTEHYPPYRPFRVEDMDQNPFRCFVGWAWDKLYSKRFILNNDLRFQEQRTSNDMYFTYMSLFKADKITTLEERVIYQRRNLPESLSVTREKSWWCFYDALMAMKRELEAMGLFEWERVHFENYALHSCLWNLETLPEVTAHELFHKLEQEWFDSLGISELRNQEFEYQDEKEKLMLLVERNTEGLAMCREKYQKQQSVQQEKQQKYTEIALSSGIENNGHAKSREDFESEAEYYGYCLDEIRKSKSYKIGMAITWLPRKIRGW